MKINDLKDKGKIDTIDLRIFWDRADVVHLTDKDTKQVKRIKTVLAANMDSVKGDGSPTAYLDLVEDDIEKYHAGDNIRITDAYSKLRKDGKQFWIVNAHKIEKVGNLTSTLT